jgi:hypothetical protein
MLCLYVIFTWLERVVRLMHVHNYFYVGLFGQATVRNQQDP